MSFVLTTEGYINVENPALRLHKFKAISGVEKANPHISIDLENRNRYFEITFMNSIDILVSDNIQLLNQEGEYVEVDKLKLGAKLALVRTPDHIVDRLIRRPEYIQLVNELATLIISKGKMRKVDYDASYCDMVVDWSKEKIETFIYSLSSIGIYIKVKVSSNGSKKNMITADSNVLNYLDENKEIIEDGIRIKMEDMKAISVTNIDKIRDSDECKIVKSVKEVKQAKLFLKTKSGVDSWEYITICGLQCKSKNILNE